MSFLLMYFMPKFVNVKGEADGAPVMMPVSWCDSALAVHNFPALISSYLAGKKVPPLQTQCHNLPTITLKWSISMMEIFLSLDKYPALFKLKLLGAS
jgi:hypothetical protein